MRDIMKHYVCLALLVVLAGKCEANGNVDRSNKLTNIAGKQFLAVYDKYGYQLRIKAGLDACGLSGLSGLLNINQDDLIDVLFSTYKSLPEDQKLDCKEKECVQELLPLTGTSRIMQTAYMLGYKEGIEVLIKADTTVCNSYTKLANEFIKEKGKTK